MLFPLLPKYYYINEIYILVKSIWAVGKYGITKLKKALVSGNYYKETGFL